jgi:D-alanyl-D-alanine dipeptidase
MRDRSQAICLILCLSGMACLDAFAVEAEPTCPARAMSVLAPARQLVTVATPSWNSQTATMAVWERQTSQSVWRQSIELQANFPSEAVVGKSGLAWGYGYAALQGVGESYGRLKQEGDGRSPAGIYAIGKRFGFAEANSETYRRISADTYCVDDPSSRYYNQIIDANGIATDWQSAERMRDIDLYRSGFAIEYRSDARSRGGSCIFLHIWRARGKGTSGCTAVPESAMNVLQNWLKPIYKPALAILPRQQFTDWAACFPGVSVTAEPSSH